MHLRKVGAVSVVKDQRFFSRSTCVSRSCLANRPGSREVLGLAAHKTPYSNRVSAIAVLRFRETRFCGQSQSSNTALVKPMSFSQKPQLINEPLFKEPRPLQDTKLRMHRPVRFVLSIFGGFFLLFCQHRHLPPRLRYLLKRHRVPGHLACHFFALFSVFAVCCGGFHMKVPSPRERSAKLRVPLKIISNSREQICISEIPCNYWGLVKMMRVEEYRMWAAMCLRISQQVIDPERRAQLVEMAQRWYDLADRVEDRSKKTPSDMRRSGFGSEDL